MSGYYWLKEPGDPSDDESKQEIIVNPEDFIQTVREDLESKGYVGYALGQPASLGKELWFQICVLDPQNDVPSDLLVYVEEKNAIAHHDKPQLALNNEFNYKYDRGLENYEFTLTNKKITRIFPEKELTGTFDRQGNFKTMELVDSQ